MVSLIFVGINFRGISENDSFKDILTLVVNGSFHGVKHMHFNERLFSWINSILISSKLVLKEYC